MLVSTIETYTFAEKYILFGFEFNWKVPYALGAMLPPTVIVDVIIGFTGPTAPVEPW